MTTTCKLFGVSCCVFYILEKENMWEFSWNDSCFELCLCEIRGFHWKIRRRFLFLILRRNIVPQKETPRPTKQSLFNVSANPSKEQQMSETDFWWHNKLCLKSTNCVTHHNSFRSIYINTNTWWCEWTPSVALVWIQKTSDRLQWSIHENFTESVRTDIYVPKTNKIHNLQEAQDKEINLSVVAQRKSVWYSQMLCLARL